MKVGCKAVKRNLYDCNGDDVMCTGWYMCEPVERPDMTNVAELLERRAGVL
jgi:hypothetical protein